MLFASDPFLSAMVSIMTSRVTPAGTVVASLLPLSSAKPLGVDSAEADASESESRSGSSADMHADEDDADSPVAARSAMLCMRDCAYTPFCLVCEAAKKSC